MLTTAKLNGTPERFARVTRDDMAAEHQAHCIQGPYRREGTQWFFWMLVGLSLASAVVTLWLTV